MLKDGIPCRITCTGHSMRPLLRSGDVIEISPCKEDTSRSGDIVLAREKETGRFLVHRVIKRFSDGSRLLKGDNCEYADKVFTKSEILGNVSLFSSGKRLLHTWPAKRLIALASRSGRKMVTTGMAIRSFIKR